MFLFSDWFPFITKGFESALYNAASAPVLPHGTAPISSGVSLIPVIGPVNKGASSYIYVCNIPDSPYSPALTNALKGIACISMSLTVAICIISCSTIPG